MALSTRSRTLLGSSPSDSLLRCLPMAFVLGWGLLAGGEVFAPQGAPAAALVVATVCGLLLGSEAGFWGGFTVGLAADLLSSLPLGTQAFSAALLGLGMGSLSRILSPSSWTSPALLVALACIPYRFLLTLVAQLGGHPHSLPALGSMVSLLPWDVGAGILVYLVLHRWLALRR